MVTASLENLPDNPLFNGAAFVAGFIWENWQMILALWLIVGGITVLATYKSLERDGYDNYTTVRKGARSFLLFPFSRLISFLNG